MLGEQKARVRGGKWGASFSMCPFFPKSPFPSAVPCCADASLHPFWPPLRNTSARGDAAEPVPRPCGLIQQLPPKNPSKAYPSSCSSATLHAPTYAKRPQFCRFLLRKVKKKASGSDSFVASNALAQRDNLQPDKLLRWQTLSIPRETPPLPRLRIRPRHQLYLRVC